MFHSYHDMIRIPQKPERPKTIEVYNCDMCDKGGWLSENDVEIHKKSSHFMVVNDYRAKHKDRFCTVCMKLQDTKEDLIRHIKSHHLLSSPNAHRIERKIYICDECTHIFFNKDLLETHILYAHTTKNNNRRNIKYTCPKCFRVYPLNSIWFHFQKHDIPSVTLCDICLTNFPNRTLLLEHVKTHPSYYMCEPCGYNSTKKHLFACHMRRHVQNDVPRKKITYGLMSRVFKKHKKSKLIRYNVHNAFKGLNLPKFVEICTLCQEICVSKYQVKVHILKYHRVPDEYEKKKHICVCGEEFNYRVVLKQHILKMKGLHHPVDDIFINNATANDQIQDIEIPRLEANADTVANAQCDGNPDKVANAQCEGEVVTNEDHLNNENTKNKIKVEVCNKIEIEISNITSNIIDHMDYTATEGPDQTSSVVSEANVLNEIN